MEIKSDFFFVGDWVSARALIAYMTNACQVEWSNRLSSGAKADFLPILDSQLVSKINCLWTRHGEVSWESENLHSFTHSTNTY